MGAQKLGEAPARAGVAWGDGESRSRLLEQDEIGLNRILGFPDAERL
jgi:hypothetical protein